MAGEGDASTPLTMPPLEEGAPPERSLRYIDTHCRVHPPPLQTWHRLVYQYQHQQRQWQGQGQEQGQGRGQGQEWGQGREGWQG